MKDIQFTKRPIRNLFKRFAEKFKEFFMLNDDIEEVTPEIIEKTFPRSEYYIEPEPSLEELGIRRVEKTQVREQSNVSWKEFKENNKIVSEYFASRNEVIYEQPRLKLIS